MGQLPLALQLQRHASFETFVDADGGAAREHVRSVAVGERGDSVWLAGPAGAGKTHLLAAACRLASASGRRAMYLALEPTADPDSLAELEAIDLLAVDDLDRVAGLAAWEQALFRVLNARLETGGLLVGAVHLPRDCGFALADLVSRATAAVCYRLAPLDDRQLREAFGRHAKARGLTFDEAAGNYLLSRVGRHPAELVGWLEHLDRVTLAEQRRITIPLLRREIERRSGESA